MLSNRQAAASGSCGPVGRSHPKRVGIVRTGWPKPPQALRVRAATLAEATPPPSGSCEQVGRSHPKRVGIVRTGWPKPPQALRVRAATLAKATPSASGSCRHVGRSHLGGPGSRGQTCPHQRKRPRRAWPARPHETTCPGSRGQTCPHQRQGSRSPGHAYPQASQVSPTRSEGIPQPPSASRLASAGPSTPFAWSNQRPPGPWRVIRRSRPTSGKVTRRKHRWMNE